MKKALSILLAITFVCCVFIAVPDENAMTIENEGKGNKTVFSLEVYLSNLAAIANEIPSIQGLIEIWEDKDSITSTPGQVTDEQGFWDKSIAFFDGIGSFFSNIWQSVSYLVSMLAGIFRILPALLPWNATKTVEVT